MIIDVIELLRRFDESATIEKIRLVDLARAERHTWAEISSALGYSDRSGAAVWRKRQKLSPE